MLVAGFDHATAGQLKIVKDGWVMKVSKEVVIPPTDMVEVVKWEAAVTMVVTVAAAGNQEMRKYAGILVVSSKHCL
ncbi:hypothetical protein EMCRGX_G009518 [Ephydatia muelleri]